MTDLPVPQWIADLIERTAQQQEQARASWTLRTLFHRPEGDTVRIRRSPEVERQLAAQRAADERARLISSAVFNRMAELARQEASQ